MKEPTYFFKKNNFDLLHDRIKTAPKIALFLDFDGTLVPIQKDPARCFLSEETKKQLRSIAGSQNCYLSILSGRMLSDIKKRVGIHKIYYGGNHGVDISGPDIRYTHPKALKAKPLIRGVKYLLKKEIAGIKGAWLEDKKFTLTLHFRAVKKGDISSVKKTFYKIAKRFSEENLLAVIKGKKVLELTLDISWDKGKAALLILKAMKDKCFPVYVGDDLTDETAFSVFSEEGITIRVGKSKKTFADYYLKGQWEVSEFLHRFILSFQEGGI